MENETAEKKKRAGRRLSIPILALVAGLFVLFTFTGRIRTAVTADRVEIGGDYWPDRTVLFADVSDVRLVESFSPGSRTNGFGGGKLNEGHFSNDLFGRYILYAYAGCHSCVALETADGVVAVNAETPAATKALYSSIRDAWLRFQKN